jgi:DNA-binding CsgD family transcriptional regulator
MLNQTKFRPYLNSQLSSFASICYSQQIAQVCTQIANGEFDLIGTNLILNNGASQALTNDVDAYVKYVQNGLDKVDMQWKTDFAQKSQDDFPGDLFQDPCQIRVREILSQQFQHHHPYRIVRRSHELTLIYTCITRQKIEDTQKFYQQTHQKLKECVVFLYDSLLELCAENLPLLKYTRFYENKTYRQNFISTGHQPQPMQLTERELECLYWASRGKSSDEIALILTKSKNTVKHQLQSAINKLQAQNIAHAVYLACTNGVIT